MASSLERSRARDLGLTFGRYPTGTMNAITDVDGLLVGHVTLIEGDRTRTGATVIRPHPGNLYQEKVPAGLAILNGYGKLAGATQVMELGEIETPIVLTNTLAVGRGIEATVGWSLAQEGNERVTSVNAVVGETNDGRLNDIRAARPSVAEIRSAIDTATNGPVTEGAVGAGTGTVSFGFKGGIGTSSRLVGEFSLGVLVQSNFGGTLRIDGRPLLGEMADPDGSIMIVAATDAPLSDRNLRRLAERCFGGLARTGAALSNGSGDYALAFSTHADVRRTPARRRAVQSIPELPNELVSPLFEAAIEATEEAILNSLCMATDMAGFDAAKGRPSKVAALPLERLPR
ncbi:P1 family peptidase [Dongia sp.]|uniref:P1 family peptidase n=1 Tax=Dongia sp. TaxID=1977262 RepID=UPI0035AFC9DB